MVQGMSQIKANGKEFTRVDEARIRLASWGGIIRGLSMRGGPATRVYSQSSFLNVRVDGDTYRDRLELGERTRKAVQVDGWMDRIKEASPNHYTAAVIAYVMLPWKDQFERRLIAWKKETGLKGQTRFYECLRAVERDIAMQIGLDESD